MDIPGHDETDMRVSGSNGLPLCLRQLHSLNAINAFFRSFLSHAHTLSHSLKMKWNKKLYLSVKIAGIAEKTLINSNDDFI